MPSPLYTAENTNIAYALRWSLAVFWKQAAPDDATWLPLLQAAAEPDGIRILEHRLTQENTSQFLISTKPHVSPAACIRSVKGRLQYLVREVSPKPFRRNYRVCSLGEANQKAIEQYVSTQTMHHPLADFRARAIFDQHQFTDDSLNLSLARRSAHGEFVYNLHLVAVHQERHAEISEEFLQKSSGMLRKVAGKRLHLLSRVGMLADHLHTTVGCIVNESPLEVGLSYLNNLAFAHGMRPVFQYGFYVGTFGPYDMKAVRWNL
jgi:REP element-mobilizing transposase RayT